MPGSAGSSRKTPRPAGTASVTTVTPSTFSAPSSRFQATAASLSSAVRTQRLTSCLLWARLFAGGAAWWRLSRREELLRSGLEAGVAGFIVRRTPRLHSGASIINARLLKWPTYTIAHAIGRFSECSLPVLVIVHFAAARTRAETPDLSCTFLSVLYLTHNATVSKHVSEE